MKCTQCGHVNDAGVVICSKCDHILDTSFLGDDYLGGAPPLDDEALTGPPTFQSDKTGSFLTAQTSNGTRLLEKEPVPTSAPAVLFERDAVLAVAPGVDVAALALSPFESHVLAFINGERPVARLRSLAGVGAEDLRICLGMLSDRGVLVRVATARDAFDDGQKTGTASLEGLPLDDVGGFEEEQRTDAILTPEDLLESDDAGILVPEITPLPVAPRAHVAPVDLAAVALDFVDEESPMTLEPGASPFANVPRGLTPARGIPPPAVARGAPAPLPPMTPSQAPRSAPAAAPAAGVRPALRAPGLQVTAPTPAPTPAPVAAAPAAPAAPAVRRPPTENQLKARQAYELAMKDIKDNKLSRALTYARAARDLDPENDLYKDLIANWGKQRQAAPPPNGPKR